MWLEREHEHFKGVYGSLVIFSKELFKGNCVFLELCFCFEDLPFPHQYVLIIPGDCVLFGLHSVLGTWETEVRREQYSHFWHTSTVSSYRGK